MIHAEGLLELFEHVIFLPRRQPGRPFRGHRLQFVDPSHEILSRLAVANLLSAHVHADRVGRRLRIAASRIPVERLQPLPVTCALTLSCADFLSAPSGSSFQTARAPPSDSRFNSWDRAMTVAAQYVEYVDFRSRFQVG